MDTTILTAFLATLDAWATCATTRDLTRALEVLADELRERVPASWQAQQAVNALETWRQAIDRPSHQQ